MTHQQQPGGPQGAMPGMEHAGHEMGGMQMQGQFGPYPMSREASGTAWEPDSTPLPVAGHCGAGLDRLRPNRGFALPSASDDRQTLLDGGALGEAAWA